MYVLIPRKAKFIVNADLHTVAVAKKWESWGVLLGASIFDTFQSVVAETKELAISRFKQVTLDALYCYDDVRQNRISPSDFRIEVWCGEVDDSGKFWPHNHTTDILFSKKA